LSVENELTRVETHFAFGENWASYARNISKMEVVEAISGLRRLLGDGDLANKRFLDVGSGSGIHSLAALHLGAKEVIAVDLDANSVSTTRQLLDESFPHGNYQVKHFSVFDLDPAADGRFDVVYSWGVLHHTGDMVRAIRQCAGMVVPGGEFVFALYHKTSCCPFWTAEKRWYAKASRGAQAVARRIYVGIAALRRWFRGRSFKRYTREYRGNRGMDFLHDVHDWLGGYPYESISPDDVEKLMRPMGFCLVRCFVRDWFGAQLGLFGSGCDEYVYCLPQTGARTDLGEYASCGE
jgi:2-polyprenyl-3-methyl-5-hydroxy-6-metoxy-1,4-benzoquinol methylase